VLAVFSLLYCVVHVSNDCLAMATSIGRLCSRNIVTEVLAHTRAEPSLENTHSTPTSTTIFSVV
jgi:hypothetical protein